MSFVNAFGYFLVKFSILYIHIQLHVKTEGEDWAGCEFLARPEQGGEPGGRMMMGLNTRVPRSPGTFSAWSTSSRTYTHSHRDQRPEQNRTGHGNSVLYSTSYYDEELMPATHSTTRVTNLHSQLLRYTEIISFCVIIFSIETWE